MEKRLSCVEINVDNLSENKSISNLSKKISENVDKIFEEENSNKEISSNEIKTLNQSLK